MKKIVKLFVLLSVMLLALVGCGNGGSEVVEVRPELRVAAGYNSDKTGISFQNADVTKDGITLSDGVTYQTGDLKPTWVYLSNLLGVDFIDSYSGKTAANEFEDKQNQLDQVDIVTGTAAQLNAAGAEGKLVNFMDYIDQMPNLKAFLDNNKIARLTITGDTSTGAIYFTPYFDGNDDIERMPLIRADFVRTLLDGDAEYHGANRALASYVYQPYVTEDYTVESLTADGTGTQNISKSAAKNIVAQMNATPGLTGDSAVAMFRAYIDDQYAGVYANRSDLFLGYDAAWDVDEMVALLRCAVASLDDNDGNPISGLFPRESDNNQRRVDLFRFAGHLFGVRGLESRKDYLYFDKEGNLHSALSEAATYDAMERMNQMVKEGLIYIDEAAVNSGNMLEKDAGLMSYDYNQTQTLMNVTKLQDGEEYVAIMVPVAKWDDGEGAKWMRFTESWRSVKTEGWAVTTAGCAADEEKLAKALALFDYAFSVQGQITMSYGPDAFIKVKDANATVNTWADVSKKYETFLFNGQEMPVVTDGCYDDCFNFAGGNYTNFARQYLGSTLNGFPKLQSFEYQMTTEVGKKGAAVLSAAIASDVIKHPILDVCDNMWYTSIPTALPTTPEQTAAVNGYADLNTNFNQAKGGVSYLVNMIADGYNVMAGAEGNAAGYADFVASTYGEANRLAIYQSQWALLDAYYKTIK